MVEVERLQGPGPWVLSHADGASGIYKQYVVHIDGSHVNVLVGMLFVLANVASFPRTGKQLAEKIGFAGRTVLPPCPAPAFPEGLGVPLPYHEIADFDPFLVYGAKILCNCHVSKSVASIAVKIC